MPAEQQNGRFDDELTSSRSIECLLCSELGCKRPIKQSRSQEDVAQWVKAVTAEFEAHYSNFARALPTKPSSPSLPSHPVAPMTPPQSHYTAFVAVAEHQEPEDYEAASPSSTATSAAWTWFSFPPYPERDDDSDSATSANGDSIIPVSTDSAFSSSAAGFSAALPFEPLSPPLPSLPVVPMTSPQPIHQTASDVASADYEKPEDDEPASPWTVAASPACSYFSFPPYPDRDDDSDSATSADGDCVTPDSASSASSATSVSAPARKKVAASTHSRQSSKSGSSVVSWFPLTWLPLKSAPEARTAYDRTQNPLSSVYACAEPSTLVSTAVKPWAFPSRLTVEVPHSAFFDDSRDWPIRYPHLVCSIRFPLRWEKMALQERRQPRYHEIILN